jgi:succinate-semialdehyde dehydrogenase/glutarate-semialdehyde dehydrogenase
LEKAKAYVAGDPMNEATLLGPMARADLRAQLADQVERCKKAGDKCLLGGQMPEGPSCFYPATVFTDIQTDSPAMTEELFGPVICIIGVKDEAAALALANDTIYGLGASVYTQDLKKGEHIAANVLQAGCCNVNRLVGSDPRMPFGGVKQSGYGRELASPGMHEFMNVKSVVIEG